MGIKLKNYIKNPEEYLTYEEAEKLFLAAGYKDSRTRINYIGFTQSIVEVSTILELTNEQKNITDNNSAHDGDMINFTSSFKERLEVTTNSYSGFKFLKAKTIESYNCTEGVA